MSSRSQTPEDGGRAGEPVQPSLRRMRRFGVRPDRELGQNFLIDSNILGVIDRAAGLSPLGGSTASGGTAPHTVETGKGSGETPPHTVETGKGSGGTPPHTVETGKGSAGIPNTSQTGVNVVLEIGGGLGVLTEHLAPLVAHVHVVEVDTRLREALLDATAAHENVTVHWADAMTMDLAALSPAPTKVIANLPYGVAAGALLRTIEELPHVELWVAMVQREVGERLAAAPGTAAYGVPSAIAQLSCEVSVLRAIPRTVFHPVPNVDSVLVGMRRIGPAPPAGVRALVRGAFAHRRKTLAGALQLSGLAVGGPAGGDSRARTRAALAELGLPEDIRAERLSPQEFRALAGKLGLS